MRALITLLKRAWTDPFLRKSGVFFIASLVVAFLNYLYYPVLARRLSLQEFGDVQALFSLWSQITILLGGFSMAAVHASVNCENAMECRAIIKALRQYALMTVLGLFLVLCVSASFVASALHFSHPSLLILLAALLVTNTFFTLRIAFLQGKSLFVRISVSNILVAIGRLLFALFFVWLGWQAFGAVFGLVVAQLCALAVVYIKTPHDTIADGVDLFILTSTRLRQELKHVLFVMCSMSYVTALYVTDILIVKHYFAPTIAGGYSGISTIANIAYFITGPITAVLLSNLKRTQTSKELLRHYRKAFLLILLIGGGVASVFTFAPQFIVGLLMGTRYLSYAHLLPWLVGAFFFASLNNLSMSTGLALQRRRLIILAFCGMSLLILLTMFRHESLEQVVRNFFWTDFLAAIASFLCILPDLRTKTV